MQHWQGAGHEIPSNCGPFSRGLPRWGRCDALCDRGKGPVVVYPREGPVQDLTDGAFCRRSCRSCPCVSMSDSLVERPPRLIRPPHTCNTGKLTTSSPMRPEFSCPRACRPPFISEKTGNPTCNLAPFFMALQRCYARYVSGWRQQITPPNLSVLDRLLGTFGRPFVWQHLH